MLLMLDARTSCSQMKARLVNMVQQGRSRQAAARPLKAATVEASPIWRRSESPASQQLGPDLPEQV